MRILVVGTGTLGGNLAEHLTRTAPQWELGLLDFDRVEERNLRNQPYLAHQVGKSKVESLAENLFRISGARPQTVHKQLTAGNAARLCQGYDLVVDCLDNHQARTDLQNACRKTGQRLLHLGLAADYAEAHWDPNYRVPPDTPRDPCANPLSRSLSLAAILLFEKALESGQNYGCTSGDLHISPLP